MERQEIIDEILKANLVENCVRYQAKGANKYLRDELTQTVWLFLLTYNLEKLRNAAEERHLSALITAFIKHQYWSNNSKFHKTYRKYEPLLVELDEAMEIEE